MKKYSSIISIALLFAFVSTSDAQKLGSAKGGSKADSGMKNIIECLSKVRLSSSDYYLVKKAGSGGKLSGKEENQLANLAAKHCGKSEKSGKSSKGKLSSGRTAEMKGAKGAAGKGDARAAKGSKDGKLGKSGRTAEMKGAKGAAGKGDARAAKGSSQVGGKLGKSGRTAEMKGAKGAAGKGDARAAKGDAKAKSDKLSKDDN